MAANGLSPVVRSGGKSGPAGLRGLLKSPPHRAGQAPAALRATRFNPCRFARFQPLFYQLTSLFFPA